VWSHETSLCLFLIFTASGIFYWFYRNAHPRAYSSPVVWALIALTAGWGIVGSGAILVRVMNLRTWHLKRNCNFYATNPSQCKGEGLDRWKRSVEIRDSMDLMAPMADLNRAGMLICIVSFGVMFVGAGLMTPFTTVGGLSGPFSVICYSLFLLGIGVWMKNISDVS